MKKNTSPAKEWVEILRRNNLNPALYVVVKELPYSLIVKNRETGEHDVIKK